MSKESTETIFYTLRDLSVNAHNHETDYQDIAKDLLLSIPWNTWPKNPQGEMLYQAVYALANDNLKTRLVWEKRWECPYHLGNEGGWYWLASWAIHEPLSYYLKGNDQ